MTSNGWEPTPDVIAAEQAVLGASIQSRDVTETAGGMLAPGDFYRPAHAAVFAACLELVDNGRPVDMTAVLGALADAGAVENSGGGPALHTLQQHAAPGPAVPWHTRRVAEDAVRRRLHAAGGQITQLATGPGFDLEQSADGARRQLEQALTGMDADDAYTAADLLPEVVDDLEQLDADDEGIPTGWLDLDDVLPGLRPGQLIVIGARPGIGKSVIGLGLARNAAEQGAPTLYSSLEMSRKELMHRAIAAETRISLDKLQRRDLAEDDWHRITWARPRVASPHLTIDDLPKVSIAHIRARLRGMAREAAPQLLVVDYLQLLAAPQAERREQEVAQLTRDLKVLAREFALPVVVLAQLNRASETRHDKRPQLADLRESGAVEQDGDVVLLLHREDAYDPESDRAGEIDLIVAKNRQGPTKTVTLAWQGHYARAANIARGSQ